MMEAVLFQRASDGGAFDETELMSREVVGEVAGLVPPHVLVPGRLGADVNPDTSWSFSSSTSR